MSVTAGKSRQQEQVSPVAQSRKRFVLQAPTMHLCSAGLLCFCTVQGLLPRDCDAQLCPRATRRSQVILAWVKLTNETTTAFYGEGNIPEKGKGTK